MFVAIVRRPSDLARTRALRHIGRCLAYVRPAELDPGDDGLTVRPEAAWRVGSGDA
ncbi:MAG: hypothetical protein R3B49_01660 [Phycisphaerales bacterium]